MLHYAVASPLWMHGHTKIRVEWIRQKALEDLAQGFNPENPENKRFALKLKGREVTR
jgi:hypothetical protein